MHSGTPSKLMRRRRVAKGIPELGTALSDGLLSEYRAGEISRLPPREQKIALAHWTGRALAARDGQRLAAAVLRSYLAQHTGRVALDELCNVIRAEMRTTTTSMSLPNQ